METNALSPTVSKHREWWLAVEFEKRPFGRKQFDMALNLLGAGERYDLILENGKTLARGIFDHNTDPALLHRLITAVSDWTGAALHTADGMLRDRDIKCLARMIACAKGAPPCRSGDIPARVGFLGCHLEDVNIGLTGFAYPIRGYRPWWFSFYRTRKNAMECYDLDEDTLRQTLARGCLCPRHPPATWVLVDRLPKTIDLKMHRDFRIWMKTDPKIAPGRMKLFPAVIPRKADRYNEWVEKVILRNLPDISDEA